MRPFALLTALLVLAFPARAQDYPSRLIKLIQGFPPGGNVEFVARLLGHEMSKSLGQAIIVESKPGQAGSLAAEAVANAEPDGYTPCSSPVPSRHRGDLQEAEIRPGGRLRVDLDRKLLPVHRLCAQRFEMGEFRRSARCRARSAGEGQLRHCGKRLDRAHDDGAHRQDRGR